MANPRSFVYIEGQKWYHRLIKQADSDDSSGSIGGVAADIAVPRTATGRRRPRVRGLFEDFPQNTMRERLVTQMTDQQNTRLFAVFNSYLEFGKYQLKFSPEKRCFYETILGEFPQKPHFDIDINIEKGPGIDAEAVKNNLIDSAVDVLAEHGITLDIPSDVLVFTSHGPSKKSYHVVIDHYHHMNNLEAKAFYEDVLVKMQPEFSEFIDRSVYSSKQQFRVVDSQKLNSGRPKTLNETWMYHDTEIVYRYIEEPEGDGHRMILQLEASLVTQVSSCTALPNFIKVDETENDIKPRYDDGVEITREIGLRALQLLADQAGVSIRDRRFPYRYSTIQGGIVILKRISPSKCRVCNRIHENENPYMLIVGEEMNVYFNCRRSDKNFYVGKLGSDSDGDTSPNHTTQSGGAESDRQSPPFSTHNVVETVAEMARSSVGVSPVRNPSNSYGQVQQQHINRILRSIGNANSTSNTATLGGLKWTS